MKLYPNKNNIILDKRGALYFVQNLPKERWETIDTIVLDPPYYDLDNPEHVEIINGRTKLKNKKIHWGGTLAPETRLMLSADRKEILRIIKERKKEDARILYFHSKFDYLPKVPELCCIHTWIKPINITIAGNCERNNGEYILIEGPLLKGKIKGQILNKYIANCQPEMKSIRGMNELVRSCAKPGKLFDELYRHLNSRHILDPFAGFGRSISAALLRGIMVDACDIDLTLKSQWSYYQNHQTLEDMFMYE